MFRRIIIEHKYYFESYRNILTDFQWQLLQAIAKEKEVEEITSKGFIRKHQLGSASSVKTAVNSLLKKELISRIDGNYKIDDLLFSAWLAS